MTGLQPEVLLADARAATGLDDFGPDDFREGLSALCESLNADARLNDLGAAAFPGMLVGSLSNRLRIVDWRARHPEVADERIEAPIVVIGMFRAGTTLLSRLLDQDPRNRALLMWEAGDSAPPPTIANHRSGPRVDAVHASNAMLAEINPMIEVVHHEQADEATECITVMGQDFKSLTYEAVANVPGYHRWLMDVDQRSAYEYHRAALPGAAERGSARSVDAQEPSPCDRARVPHRGVSGRSTRPAAPRPGRAHCVGLQPDQHAVVDVQRLRSPAVHR